MKCHWPSMTVPGPALGPGRRGRSQHERGARRGITQNAAPFDLIAYLPEGPSSRRDENATRCFVPDYCP